MIQGGEFLEPGLIHLHKQGEICEANRIMAITTDRPWRCLNCKSQLRVDQEFCRCGDRVISIKRMAELAGQRKADGK